MKRPIELPYAYVRRAYGVDPQIGARVSHTEVAKRGVIVRRKAYDQYVWVRFDDEQDAKPCHPKALDYAPDEAA